MTSVPPRTLNSILNDQLDRDDGAKVVSRSLQVFLETRLEEHDPDLLVQDALVKKVGDLITISFRVGSALKYQGKVMEWLEQDLLMETEPITTLLDKALVETVKEFRGD